MTTHTALCTTTLDDTTSSLIDTAATVWAVVVAAEQLPATPERRQELAETRRRLSDYLVAAGISEDELRRHLIETYDAKNGEAEMTPCPPGNCLA